MRLEYLPHPEYPVLQFEFETDEILAYIAAHIAALEAAPENHSPHRQRVRDHQERVVLPFIHLQAEYRRLLEEKTLDTLTWNDFADLMGPKWFAMYQLEFGFGTVTCPLCQEVYSGADLLTYDWNEAAFGGILCTCPQDHEILRLNSRIGEATEPPRPFTRTLRIRPGMI